MTALRAAPYPQDGLFGQTSPAAAPVRSASSLTLLRLRLRNFKGIKEFDLDTAGGDVSVWGDNATGKTTLFDGFLWLLFDKDSANHKAFEIKTLDENNQPLHGLEHEVEGTFLVNGRTVTLKKVYAEQWTKKRGSAEKVFSGHTTDYAVDGVPVAKGEYERRIAGIVDEGIFRLLSDPGYFNEQLHWQERREILLEVCGDISDSDVIASDPKLADLATILGGRNLEDHRKVIQASRTKINKDLEQVPIRVSEVQRGLPDIAGIVPDALTADIDKARNARQAKADELARADNGGAWVDKQNRLSQVRARLLEIESEHRNKANNAISDRRRQVQEAQYAAENAKRDLDRLNADIAEKEREASRLGTQLEQLRNQWDQVDAEEFSHTDETLCPACGQNLPQERVEAARQKALEAFNLSKAQRLERVTADGRATKEKKERIEAEVKRLGGNAQAAQKGLESARASASKLGGELDKLQTPYADTVSGDAEYQRLAAERDKLGSEIERLKAGAQADLSGIRQEIDGLNQAIASLEQLAAQYRQHQAATQRITELQAEEKRLAAEFERLERELYLTEEFVRAKVRLLTDKINGRFEYARFKLFEEQVNGGLSECCETLYQGVPYNSNLNRGARINVGLDIISTLSEHYGFRAPIWVDNREAVTRLIPIDAQVISLIVSEPDKVLRVEREAV